MLAIPFAGNPLDRASERRSDADWIAAQRRDANSLVWPYWRLQPLLRGERDLVEAGYLKASITDEIAAGEAVSVFLGLDGERALFALDIGAAEDPSTGGGLAGLGYFRDARTAAQLLPLKDAAILSQAKALIDWHQRHGFCPN